MFSICLNGPPFSRYSCLKAVRLGLPEQRIFIVEQFWHMPIFWHLGMSLPEKFQLPSPKGFGVIGDQNLDWDYFFTVALKFCTLPVPSVLVLAISFLYPWKRGTLPYHHLFSVCFNRPLFLRYSHLKLNALGPSQAKNIYRWTILTYVHLLASRDVSPRKKFSSLAQRVSEL